MKRLLPAGAAIAAVAAATLFAFSGSGASPAATTSPSPEVTESSTPEPQTPEPTPDLFLPVPTVDPKPTPAADAEWTPPADYTGTFRYGDWVEVQGEDTCLNVRSQPGLTVPGISPPVETQKLNCLPHAFVGQLSFGPEYWGKQEVPVQADGHWWWNLLGQGWIVEDWLTFVRSDDGSAFTPRPDLAGSGLIAFARPSGVWLASPDADAPRHILPIIENVEGISDIRWSPDGQRIAVGMWITTGATTRIIDVHGTLVQEFPGVSEPRWSPAGGWLAGTMSTGTESYPAVIELASGSVTRVSDYGNSPEWSPDGSTVAVICRGYTWDEWQPDGSTITRTVDCGGDGVQVISLADLSRRVVRPVDRNSDEYLVRVSWSPDGDTIVVSGSALSCQGYELIDVASATQVGCLALPNLATFGGRCGGPSDSGETDWSPDGTTLAYHWQFQEGQNGVALVDIATGERRMILTTGASSVGYSSDGAHLIFESAGYVWIADADATNVTRITDGSAPAWQPVP